MEFPVRHQREGQVNEQLAARYINHTMQLEPDGEIINLDYDPIKLYKNLETNNEGPFNDQFYADIKLILQSYITLRKRLFKIVRSSNSYANVHFLKLARIVQKYRITDKIIDEKHMTKAITMQRLMYLFPHIMAKVVTIDLNVESIIPQNVLQNTGLTTISPVCFWKSSFGLIPKYVADVESEGLRMKVIKSMLLAQYEQQEVIHEENEFRLRKSPLERMQAVLVNCKVIYNSNHILGALRCVSYKMFFVTDPYEGKKFDYEKAAQAFDEGFGELNKVLDNVFYLRPGTGIERGDFQDIQNVFSL